MSESSIQLGPEESREIHEIVNAILVRYTNNDPSKADSLELPLKTLMHSLVDNVIDRAQKKRAQSPKPTEKMSVLARVQNRLKAFNKNNSQIFIRRSLNLSTSSLKASPSLHGKSISYANQYAKAHRFSKSKRKLDLSCDRSPGPAYYIGHESSISSITTDFGKSNVPRIGFFRVTSEAPSPDTYSPSNYCISRYS